MKKALISVADKVNLEVILEKLKNMDYQFISTGTTAKVIAELGYEVQKVSDVIKFEEILGGRVKTLHPNIHGAILSRRTSADRDDLKKYQIEEIDVVVCNLYPFEKTIENPDVDFQTAIENIDIGGVTLLRAAAKNHAHVTVLCDPEDYQNFDSNNNLEYAVKAFEHTAYYDILISKFLQKDIAYHSDKLLIGAKKEFDLRYGENAHQKAAYYQNNDNIDYSLKNSEIIHGKQLSYNNIKDVDSALNLIGEFSDITVAAFKHNTPCGVGFGKDVNEAFDNCLRMDDVSIFGGIIVCNEKIDLELANKLSKIFLEIIIAPEYDEDALDKLKGKKNLRLLKSQMKTRSLVNEVVSINNGFLVQEKDQNNINEEEHINVTKRKVDKNLLPMMIKAQIVCKYVKSNAIVIANADGIISQGGGQTSRIDAAQIAISKAKEKGFTSDLIMASDAFFPFSDNVELAHQNGVTAIIQPGGSIKDQEVIDKADEFDMAMIFTKVRHFKH